MELEHCINFIVTRPNIRCISCFKAALAPYGVTRDSTGAAPLGRGRTNRTAVPDRLYLDASTMTGILDRMEQED